LTRPRSALRKNGTRRLVGLPVPADAIPELARLVRDLGADDLADRLERALVDDVKLLALSLEDRFAAKVGTGLGTDLREPQTI
jgi:hypothetical protein